MSNFYFSLENDPKGGPLDDFFFILGLNLLKANFQKLKSSQVPACAELGPAQPQLVSSFLCVGGSLEISPLWYGMGVGVCCIFRK